jgi:hypothetical protein
MPSRSTQSRSLAFAQFESMLRGVLPSAAGSARAIFDSSMTALRSTGFTPPASIFAVNTSPGEMFSTMQAGISLSLPSTALAVAAKTIIVALCGGVLALALAELAGISLALASVIIAVVALIWWAGGVRNLLDHVREVIRTEVVEKVSAF